MAVYFHLNDYFLHGFTGFPGIPLITEKSFNAFFSSASMVWFRIKTEQKKYLLDICYNEWQTEEKYRYYASVVARHLP